MLDLNYKRVTVILSLVSINGSLGHIFNPITSYLVSKNIKAVQTVTVRIYKNCNRKQIQTCELSLCVEYQHCDFFACRLYLSMTKN